MERDFRDLADLLCQSYDDLQWQLGTLPELDVDYINDALTRHFTERELDELVMTDIGRGLILGYLSFSKHAIDTMPPDDNDDDET